MQLFLIQHLLLLRAKGLCHAVQRGRLYSHACQSYSILLCSKHFLAGLVASFRVQTLKARSSRVDGKRRVVCGRFRSAGPRQRASRPESTACSAHEHRVFKAGLIDRQSAPCRPPWGAATVAMCCLCALWTTLTPPTLRCLAWQKLWSSRFGRPRSYSVVRRPATGNITTALRIPFACPRSRL